MDTYKRIFVVIITSQQYPINLSCWYLCVFHQRITRKKRLTFSLNLFESSADLSYIS